VGDIRRLWEALSDPEPGPVVRADQIGADVASGLADLEAYGPEGPLPTRISSHG